MAHNRSKRNRDLETSTNQHFVLPLATQKHVFKYRAWLERDTYFGGSVTARQNGSVSH